MANGIRCSPEYGSGHLTLVEQSGRVP
uniref:Uncharacterized protein n=1 Tax=Anguilla anguilla TaxID=7936 RepID=A0A0E9VG45_ANGAN